MQRFCCLLCLQVFLVSTVFPQSADSASNRYDSIRSLVERTVQEYRDSLQREKLLQTVRETGKSLDVLLAERREQEKKEERRRWVRIGAGAVFLFALFYALARRYNTRNRH